MGFPNGVVVKNLPAKAGDTRNVDLIPGLGTHFSILAWENPLEEGCILAWRILWLEEPGRLQSRVEKS